jgi:outer membrane protein TolC
MGPAINIALPVFDQGSAALMRTASELRRAQQRTATLALDIQQGANAAYARARALHDLARRQHDEWLPLQSSLVEMLEKQVVLGFSSQFALQQARRDHLQATGLYVDALRDYWLAEAVLRRAIGAAPSPEVGSLDPLAGGER